MNLSDSQKKFLRGLAHPRKPVVIVAGNGLNDNVMAEIDGALDAHELIKVRVRVGDRDERDALVAEIVSRTGATPVQRIGHVLTLYRRNRREPRIELP
jgi:RNA-binding protein